MMGYYFGYDGYGPTWGWHVLGGILMLAFWILVIALIVLVIRRMSDSTNHRGHANSGKNALEILKERYAKSEIDKKEFEEKKKDIES